MLRLLKYSKDDVISQTVCKVKYHEWGVGITFLQAMIWKVIKKRKCDLDIRYNSSGFKQPEN